MQRVKTMQLQGNDYAKVVERLKAFREDCPNGLIETKPTLQDDGQILFTARILKDKADQTSAEGTGHSLGKNTGTKAFEKLETIAVGRALAMLGYMASGEIASSEEMEEFYVYKQEKIDDAIKTLKVSKSLDELKQRFMALGPLMAEKAVVQAKDDLKAELSKVST